MLGEARLVVVGLVRRTVQWVLGPGTSQVLLSSAAANQSDARPGYEDSGSSVGPMSHIYSFGPSVRGVAITLNFCFHLLPTECNSLESTLCQKIKVKIMDVLRMHFLEIYFINVCLKCCWLIGCIPSSRKYNKSLTIFSIFIKPLQLELRDCRRSLFYKISFKF